MHKGCFYCFCLSLLGIHASYVQAAAEQPLHTIRFVGSENYPPLQWQHPEQGAQGFIVDLEQALVANTGILAEQHLMQWEDALAAVQQGDADVVALIPSAARASTFDFSEPFYYVAHAIFSGASTGAEIASYGSFAQLEGKRVAVAAGAYAEQQLRDANYSFTLVRAEDELHCLQLVVKQRADACVEVTTTSKHLIANHQLPLQQTSPPFWPLAYSFGVKKGNQQMLTFINQQLGVLQIDGRYREIYQRWQPQLEWQPRTFTDNLKAVAWLLGALLLLAGAGWAWSYSLKSQVRFKTLRIQKELNARRKLNLKLQYHAEHDIVTGLYNRLAFSKKVQQRLHQESPAAFAVVVIKIANLESITTVFSYPVANDLLIEFSERLRKQGFIFAAHFGVGLFAAVAEAELTNERLVELAMQPLQFKSLDFEPVLAFGITRYPSNFTQSLAAQMLVKPPTADELLRQALTAVSIARKAGHTWLEYQPEIEPNADDLRLLKEFHEHGMRDFYLVYQPKLDLSSEQITGVEVLLRWNHPTLGLIAPTKFIPLFEESGLIKQVTRWVIRQTVASMQRHQLCQRGLHVSVNVSTRDLTEAGFVGFVKQAVQDIDAHCLQFEITETGLIDDSERALEVLTQLSELGIKCAVDDFGTGNSSISYLSKFPVAELKLDRSYVSDINNNDRNLKIVKSSIDLAHALGLKVTAEGVEDFAAITLLKQLGCEKAQGYVIARPLAEHDFIALVNSPFQWSASS